MATTFKPKASSVLGSGEMIEHPLPVQAEAGLSSSNTVPSAYRVEVTAVDELGSPVPDCTLQFTADRRVNVEIGGRNQWIGPGQPASAVTSLGGAVSVTTIIPEGELSSPVFQVTSPDFAASANEYSFRADHGAYVRLANRDPHFPVNAEVMRRQGLLPDSAYVNWLEPKLVDGMVAIGGIMANKTQEPPSQSPGPGEDLGSLFVWIDLRQPGQPDLRLLTRERAEEAAKKPLPDGVHICFSFEEFDQFVQEHSIWEGTSAWDLIRKLWKIINQIASQIAQLAKEAIDQVANFFVTLLQEIANLMSVPFASYFPDFIGWLRRVFALHDMFNTTQVLVYFVDQGLRNLVTMLDKGAVDFVRKNFGTLKDAIAQIDLSKLPGASMNGWSGSKGSPIGNRVRTRRGQASPHAVMANYVPSQVLAQRDRTKLEIPDWLGQACGPFVEQVKGTFSDETRKDWENALASFSALVQQSGGGKAIFDISVRQLAESLFQLLRLVLDLIEDLTIAGLELCAKILDGFRQWLAETPISIPILAPLYQKATGRDLHILDLVCLLLAAPVTILYKLFMKGVAPFSKNDVQELITNPIPWPCSLGAGAGVPVSSSPGVNKTVILVICALLYGFVYMSTEIMLDAASLPGMPRLWWVQLVTLINVIVSAAVLSLSLLVAPFVQGIKDDADKWARNYWWLSWGPPLVAFIALLIPFSMSAAYGVVQPLLLSAFAFVWLAIGIVAVVNMGASASYSIWDQIMTILAPLPLVPKPLLLGDEADLEIVWPILMGADVLGDFGVAECFFMGGDII